MNLDIDLDETERREVEPVQGGHLKHPGRLLQAGGGIGLERAPVPDASSGVMWQIAGHLPRLAGESDRQHGDSTCEGPPRVGEGNTKPSFGSGESKRQAIARKRRTRKAGRT